MLLFQGPCFFVPRPNRRIAWETSVTCRGSDGENSDDETMMVKLMKNIWWIKLMSESGNWWNIFFFFWFSTFQTNHETPFWSCDQDAKPQTMDVAPDQNLFLSILVGFALMNLPFWGTPILATAQIFPCLAFNLPGKKLAEIDALEVGSLSTHGPTLRFP